MTKLQLKAFVYQLLSFILLFGTFRYVAYNYFHQTGIFISISGFICVTLLGPKFMATKTKEGEKLFMKWIFLKGLREIG